MNSRRDFGTSLLMLQNAELLKQSRAAKINKVTSKSDDITESEEARAVRG